MYLPEYCKQYFSDSKNRKKYSILPYLEYQVLSHYLGNLIIYDVSVRIFQVLDALVSLFCRSNISAETLWDGGWLLRQLLPYSEAEFNSHHLDLLKVRTYEALPATPLKN